MARKARLMRRAIGMLAAAATCAAAQAVPLNVQVDVVGRYEFMVDAGAPAYAEDLGFVPFSFGFQFDVSDTPVATVGPVHSSYSDASLAYSHAFAYSHFTSTLALAMSPFTAELDSYNTFAGPVAPQDSVMALDYYLDYSFGGTDDGVETFSISTGYSGSNCDISSCVQYQQFLSIGTSVPLTGIADVAVPTISDAVDLLLPGPVSFSHHALDSATDWSTYSRYSGAQYVGWARVSRVPEPATLTLLALGLVGVYLAGRRRRHPALR